ncbi:MAG: D-alanyl-D-alanine carboxypeptidase family protein [Myxococcales bacterium]|nr:D-alanyl-D-alanine carboxypeptidase family protein [Myxococcales bacterium]
MSARSLRLAHLATAFTSLALAACGADAEELDVDARALHLEGADVDLEDHLEPEPDVAEYFTSPPPDALPAIDCAESKDTGYVQGKPFEITVVKIDGKKVEVATANAYYAMQQAAAADGVGLQVVSGFRTMAEQEYLYNCYINCNCNNCNLAAKPGYSNHQSGHALDLNTGAPGVYNWLETHGGAFGFERTVPKENWHYEWWGGGPATDGPCGTPLYKAEPAGQSFPALDAPPIIIQVGETYDGWFELKNLGKKTWGAHTFLAVVPDEASPLVDDSWPAPTRATRVDADTPKDAIGRFSLTIRGNEPGDFVQNFAIVDEGEDKVGWFAEDLLALHVIVIEPPPPLPGADDTTGEGSSGGDGEGSSSGEGTSAGEGSSSSSAGSSSGGDAGASAASVSDSASASGGAGFEPSVDEGCACDAGRVRAPAGALAALVLLVSGVGRRRRR